MTTETLEDRWSVMSACFDTVVDQMSAWSESESERRFFEGLKEAFAAVSWLCINGNVEVPEPTFFCICDDPDADGAICIIHAAMAIRRQAGAAVPD